MKSLEDIIAKALAPIVAKIDALDRKIEAAKKPKKEEKPKPGHQRMRAAIDQRPPFTKVPGRITASTAIKCLHSLGIDVPVSDGIVASGYTIDTKQLDEALARNNLSICERLRFKFALGQLGLLQAGKKVEWAVGQHTFSDSWSKKFQ